MILLIFPVKLDPEPDLVFAEDADEGDAFGADSLFLPFAGAAPLVSSAVASSSLSEIPGVGARVVEREARMLEPGCDRWDPSDWSSIRIRSECSNTSCVMMASVRTPILAYESPCTEASKPQEVA